MLAGVYEKRKRRTFHVVLKTNFSIYVAGYAPKTPILFKTLSCHIFIEFRLKILFPVSRYPLLSHRIEDI